MARVKKQALSPKQIHEGYRAAFQQASDLFHEANLLMSDGRFPGALHRLVITLEEIGKARILFYQGAFLVGGRAPVWQGFWKDYYSHQAKLDAALTWLALRDVLLWSEPAAIEHAIAAIRKHAKVLDLEKQRASYSEPKGDGFSIPDGIRAKELAEILQSYAQHLLGFAKSSELETDSSEEFERQLLRKFQYAHALGLVDTKPEDFFTRIAATNQPLYSPDGVLPDDQAFIERVAERYELIPKLIPVTLDRLRTSPDFASFYRDYLKKKCGYPDWMILGALFNISLNARIQPGGHEKVDVQAIAEWGEDPTVDAPLPVETFTDISRFEETMDAWLVSFLIGLGIAMEDPGKSGRHARNIAARHYGLFNRDVPHDPLLEVQAPPD